MKTKFSIYLLRLFLFSILCFAACGKNDLRKNELKFEQEKEQEENFEDIKRSKNQVQKKEKTDRFSLIDAKGNTLEERVRSPENYQRIKAEKGSFLEFLRRYGLKEDKSSVLLHNGDKKTNQKAHIAVFTLPLEKGDLQQCADSIIRLYAEYFWKTNQHDRISFLFVSGFKADYNKWKNGYRINVKGNQVSWVKSALYDDSYENFCKYLRMVFAYSGTMSMENETTEIGLADLNAGDVFLKGGSPGHVVMVIDVSVDEDGKKAFLLGQGYMPAQEFHVLKNPKHEKDPWYYEKEFSYPLETPEYVFQEGSLKRLSY